MKLVLLLICFYLASQGFAQNTQSAQGAVFHDLNANGLLDAGEPGIAAVAVSNGSDVVLTDENGNYAIPVSDDAIIFVIKPSGYNYPVNAHMLPRFYYIHKPEGSPKELKYAGVAKPARCPKVLILPCSTAMHLNSFPSSFFLIHNPTPKSKSIFTTAQSWRNLLA